MNKKKVVVKVAKKTWLVKVKDFLISIDFAGMLDHSANLAASAAVAVGITSTAELTAISIAWFVVAKAWAARLRRKAK